MTRFTVPAPSPTSSSSDESGSPTRPRVTFRRSRTPSPTGSPGASVRSKNVARAGTKPPSPTKAGPIVLKSILRKPLPKRRSLSQPLPWEKQPIPDLRRRSDPVRGIKRKRMRLGHHQSSLIWEEMGRQPDLRRSLRIASTGQIGNETNVQAGNKTPIPAANGAATDTAGDTTNNATPAPGSIDVEIPATQASEPTLEALKNVLDHPNLISLLSYNDVDGKGYKHNLSWTLGNAGNLTEIIISRKVRTGRSQKLTTKPLPESLIWHTLISLLRAVDYLHTGAGSGLLEAWQPIIHNFINPGHVYYQHLDAGRDQERIGYGVCMLGSFKRCVVLPHLVFVRKEDDEDRANRKEAFDHLSAFAPHTGYEAPELISGETGIPGPGSDLWSIGAVMVFMMTGRSAWDLILETDFLHRSSNGRTRCGSIPDSWHDIPVHERVRPLERMAGSSKIAKALPHRYWHKLRILVEALLFSDPDDRGTALQVFLEAEALYKERLAEVGRAALDWTGDFFT